MIYKKLFELQKKWIALKRNADNPFFKSKYISLDLIMETYNPLLNELNILCYHTTKDNKLSTVLLDLEDDTSIISEFAIYNTDPQKQGSEISYGKRYNLGQILNILTDEDDDGNIASSSCNIKEFYKSDKRDLLAIINDLKASTDLETATKLKDEWKELAKTEKQQEWLKKEYTKKHNELNK